MDNLGKMYLNGTGVSEDDTEAIEWFRKGARRGLPHAMNSLGVAYMSGQGVSQDKYMAAHWFRKSAAAELPQDVNKWGRRSIKAAQERAVKQLEALEAQGINIDDNKVGGALLQLFGG